MERIPLRRKGNGIFSIIMSCICAVVGLFLAMNFVAIKSDYNRTEYIWLIGGGVAILFAIIFFVVATIRRGQLTAASKQQMKAYEAIPYTPIYNYKGAIDRTRYNFYQADESEKEKPKLPKFFNASDCYDYSVLDNGNVYYGYLVQANNELFKRDFRKPGSGIVVLYSTDPYYDQNPMELEKIARALYANKRKNILRNDYNFFYNELVDTSLTGGRKVYITCLLVDRLQLPTGYLTNSLFPIVANPDESFSTFILDTRYWSDELIANFIHG